jgi:hypothetical protein
MEEILNTVNEVQEPTVEAQETVHTETPETSVKTEVAEPVKETKVVQSQEENATYAKIRREAEAKAEAKARDSVISEMYGTSHGIHTYADYKKAVQEQEMKDKGVDPETVKKYVEEHPDVKAAREYKQNQEKEAKQKEEFVEFFNEFPDVDAAKIPPEVWAENAKGKPLADAYARYLLKQNKAAEAITKANEANAGSSMGSVNGLGGDPSILTEEMIEKMTPQEMSKRWGEIKKFYNMK